MALLDVGLVLTPARAAFPLVVDDAAVCAPRAVETVFTLGAQHEDLLDTYGATWSLTTGLLPRLEASIDGGYGWRNPALGSSSNGLLDLNTGLKARLLDDPDEPFAVTLAGTVKHPVASVRQGLGSGKRDFTLNAAGTRSFGALSLDGNAGYSWIGRPIGATDPADQVHLGAALRWEPAPRGMLFTEYILTSTTHERWRDSPALLRAGGQYALTPRWLVGVAIGRRLHGSSATSLFELGLTVMH